MNEQWHKWEPIGGLSKKYDIQSIFDSSQGLKITLCELGEISEQIHVLFKGAVACYRWADETYMDHRVQNLFKEYGDSFFINWSFFKVTNSEYSKYISKTSGSISDHMELQHFAFISEEAIFEVLCSYEPSINYIHINSDHV